MCELERLFTAEFAKQSVVAGRLFTALWWAVQR